MYPKLTYFLGGFVAALGVAVTVTDPKTLDNIMTFPSRLSSYFTDSPESLFDITASKIIVEGQIYQVLDTTMDMPDQYKSALASHWATQCIDEFYKFLPDANNENENSAGKDSFGSLEGEAEKLLLSSIKTSEVISICSYRTGFTLSAYGIVRLQQYVENPTQTPLKDGAIRLSQNGEGLLFQLPAIDISNSVID